MAIDPEALAASLRRLATLAEPGPAWLRRCGRLTEACVDLSGVTGSGIMWLMEQNFPHYVARIRRGPAACSKVAESDTG